MATGQHEREKQLHREISRTVTTAIPGVEVLALEITGRERFCVYVDQPGGVDARPELQPLRPPARDIGAGPLAGDQRLFLYVSASPWTNSQTER